MSTLITPEQIAKSGTEHAHQAALFCWSHLPDTVSKYPLLGSKLLFAVPNGGFRDKVTAGKLKASGVKSGVSDIILSVARGGWFALYLEMKKPGVGKVSKEQLEFKEAVEAEGYAWACYDMWTEARDALIYYIGLPRTQRIL